MSQPTALPYGIRDIKLTKYTDGGGTTLGTTAVDLPNAQTLSFSEAEEFSELRGDDALIATRGKGATVAWSLEAGGISPPAWAILTGGAVTTSGTTPARVTTMRKKGTDGRPYFRIDGQAISDSGGDVRCSIFRAKVNDTFEGGFADGEFLISHAAGVGLPLIQTNDWLYEFVQSETAVPLTTTALVNPA